MKQNKARRNKTKKKQSKKKQGVPPSPMLPETKGPTAQITNTRANIKNGTTAQGTNPRETTNEDNGQIMNLREDTKRGQHNLRTPLKQPLPTDPNAPKSPSPHERTLRSVVRGRPRCAPGRAVPPFHMSRPPPPSLPPPPPPGGLALGLRSAPAILW
jgi:hypothetical protein